MVADPGGDDGLQTEELDHVATGGVVPIDRLGGYGSQATIPIRRLENALGPFTAEIQKLCHHGTARISDL